MIPDIDGRQRLQGELKVTTDKQGRRLVQCDALTARWEAVRQQFVDYHRPAASADEATRAAFAQLDDNTQKTCKRFCAAALEYLTDNLKDIETYQAALDRFDNDPDRFQGGRVSEEAPLGPHARSAPRSGRVG